MRWPRIQLEGARQTDPRGPRLGPRVDLTPLLYASLVRWSQNKGRAERLLNTVSARVNGAQWEGN